MRDGESAVDNESQRSELKRLIARGKEQGYLTYREINDHLPEEVFDPEQMENVISMINDMGIEVFEEAPDGETLLDGEGGSVVAAQEAEEAAKKPWLWSRRISGGPVTRCACTCARWAASNCLPVKVKSRLPGVLKTG
jgi:RNA polymerase, sigma 70 subunit, RpoD